MDPAEGAGAARRLARLPRTARLPRASRLPRPVRALLRRWRGTTLFRRFSQLAFLGFIVFVAARHRIVGEGGPIATPSPEAYCPFGGIEAAYRYISSGGSFLPHTHLSNLVLLLAVFVSVLVARGAFCGWICPFGTLQEWFRALGRLILRERVSVRHGRSYWGLRLPVRLSAALIRVDRALGYARYLVLVWILYATVKAGVLAFRDVDPYAALLSFGEDAALGGLVVLAITAALSLIVERPWCRYACPLGAAVGLVGRLSPVAIARDATSCNTCNLCTVACPLNVNLIGVTRVTDARCIGCQVCVTACPRGSLGLRLGWPLRLRLPWPARRPRPAPAY